MEEPLIPIFKPIGMSIDEFAEEVRVAQDLHDLWLYKQNFVPAKTELELQEEDLWYETLKQEMEQTSYKRWYV